LREREREREREKRRGERGEWPSGKVRYTAGRFCLEALGRSVELFVVTGR
jgi:hypothetical protein